MKPIILMAAASIAAMASTSAIAADRAELRRDVRDSERELAKQQQDLREAQMYGSARDVRKQREDVREARQDLRKDRRQAYRAGAYVRPAGWRSQAWATGQRLPASYYGQRYWVNPNQYGLARVYNGDRWVRVDRDVVRISPNGTVREVRRDWFY